MSLGLPPSRLALVFSPLRAFGEWGASRWLNLHFPSFKCLYIDSPSGSKLERLGDALRKIPSRTMSRTQLLRLMGKTNCILVRGAYQAFNQRHPMTNAQNMAIEICLLELAMASLFERKNALHFLFSNEIIQSHARSAMNAMERTSAENVIRLRGLLKNLLELDIASRNQRLTQETIELVEKAGEICQNLIREVKDIEVHNIQNSIEGIRIFVMKDE